MSVGFADVPRFLLAYSALVLLPGTVLTGLACPRTSPLDRWSLSLVAGLVSSSALYWTVARAGHPELLWGWCLAALAAVAVRPSLLRGLWGGRPDGSHALLCAVLAITLGLLVAGPVPYDSFTLAPDGRLTRAMVDFEFHLAIVRELAHTVPPQSPFTAGIQLQYHYASDLVGALLARAAGLQPTDLVVRFLPPVLLVQAVLAVFCFARLWLRSGLVAALVAGLTILGGDFTWIVAWLCRTTFAWDAAVFQAPTFPALFTANPMLPAVACLFAGLFASVEATRGGGRSWIGVAGLLFAALLEYKLFTGLHVVAALGAAALWTRVSGPGRAFAAISGIAGLAAAASLASLLLGGANSPQTVRWAPLHLLESTANAVCVLPSVASMAEWPSALRLAFLLAVALPVYLLGSLGPRLLGAPRMISALCDRRAVDRPDAACAWFLAAFLVIGFVGTAAFQLTRREEPSSYNNSVWFLVQSKYVMWIFVGQALLSIRRRGARIAAAALVVAASVPSTVAWATAGRQSVATLGREEVALARALAESCRDGAVALAPRGEADDPASSRAAAEILVLAGCRTLLAGPFAEQFISREEWDARQLDAQRFWKAWRKGSLRSDILGRYGASLVVEAVEYRPDAPPSLSVLFASDSYRLYSTLRSASER